MNRCTTYLTTDSKRKRRKNAHVGTRGATAHAGPASSTRSNDRLSNLESRASPGYVKTRQNASKARAEEECNARSAERVEPHRDTSLRTRMLSRSSAEALAVTTVHASAGALVKASANHTTERRHVQSTSHYPQLLSKRNLARKNNLRKTRYAVIRPDWDSAGGHVR